MRMIQVGDLVYIPDLSVVDESYFYIEHLAQIRRLSNICLPIHSGEEPLLKFAWVFFDEVRLLDDSALERLATTGFAFGLYFVLTNPKREALTQNDIEDFILNFPHIQYCSSYGN